MRYQRSLEIEQRLQAVLELIQLGRFSTPGLAEEVGVSIPTISRCVEALRERGHKIRAVRGESGWRYVLVPPAGKRVKRFQLHYRHETPEPYYRWHNHLCSFRCGRAYSWISRRLGPG